MDTQLMLRAIRHEREAEVARMQLASAVARDNGYSSLAWTAPPVNICFRESIVVRFASAFTRTRPLRHTSS